MKVCPRQPAQDRENSRLRPRTSAGDRGQKPPANWFQIPTAQSLSDCRTWTGCRCGFLAASSGDQAETLSPWALLP